MPFNVGPLELVIVLIIALLVIGPKRLPEMGNSIGKTIREFRAASSDVSEAISLEPDKKPANQQMSAAPAATPTEVAPPASAAEQPAPAPATVEAPSAEAPAAPRSDDA